MSRIQQHELTRRDNLMVNLLYEHKGADNCVTAKEICDKLKQNGYYIKERSLNATITRVKMERKLPICYIRSKGYFWATCKAELALVKAFHDEKCAEFDKLSYDYYKFENNMKSVLKIEKENARKETAKEILQILIGYDEEDFLQDLINIIAKRYGVEIE